MVVGADRGDHVPCGCPDLYPAAVLDLTSPLRTALSAPTSHTVPPLPAPTIRTEPLPSDPRDDPAPAFPVRPIPDVPCHDRPSRSDQPAPAEPIQAD